MSDILKKILATKVEEVAAASAIKSLAVRAEAEVQAAPRNFAGALQAKVAAGKPAVIAEIKKASPSAGVLRADFRPAEIAARATSSMVPPACQRLLIASTFQVPRVPAGRSCCLCALPVLRKDFLVDPYQGVRGRGRWGGRHPAHRVGLESCRDAGFRGHRLRPGHVGAGRGA